jgi:mannan polymerase II complex ANP1 subunit
MAKRMQFSVVGLPHYTIWHLYEPSVEDMKHMEEMEKERQKKEKAEKAEKDRLARIEEQFESPSKQWNEDKDMLDKLKKGGNQQKQKVHEEPAGEAMKKPKGPTQEQQ